MTATETNKGDPGAMPDTLKRSPQTSLVTVPVDYRALSATDLVKQINDDYAIILGSERVNLSRALVIAEKLDALRVRAKKRKEWKAKFHSYDFKMSYETASVYLRIWDHWDEIKSLAAARGVETTLLTIDAARELWATRNATDETDDDDDTDDTDDKNNHDVKADKKGDETGDEALFKAWASSLEPDEVLSWLKEVHDIEWLKKLAAELKKIIDGAAPTTSGSASEPTSAGVGLRRV